jgi:hypothetical protein
MLASVLAVRPDPAERSHRVLRQVFEREVLRWRGQFLEPAGEVLLALFDGPGRAVQCGAAAMGEARGLTVRAAAGVHIGEVDRRDRRGPIVDVADALARSAMAYEVRVSQTVVDLVPGSGIRFDARGVVRAGNPQRDLMTLAVAG